MAAAIVLLLFVVPSLPSVAARSFGNSARVLSAAAPPCLIVSNYTGASFVRHFSAARPGRSSFRNRCQEWKP